MGTYISPYATGFSWWRQNLSNVSEQIQVAIAQGQMMAQGLLVSYLDSYYIFGVLLLLIMWTPLMLKQPKIGGPTHSMH